MPLRPPPVAILPTATVSGSGQRRRNSSNEVWRCPAYRNDTYESVTLFVKPALTVRQCAVEILSAHVGRLIGLPCPESYVVLAAPKFLHRQGTKPIFAFGSRDVSSDGLITPFKDLDLMFRTLERLRYSDLASVFDEWIANSVRQPNDVLFDPSGRNVVFLDHERAMSEGVVADEQVANWLADRVMETVQSKDRAILLGRFRKAAEAAYAFSIGEPPQALQFNQDATRIYRELSQWIASRLGSLDQLLSQRVLPDQHYLPTSNPRAQPGQT